MDNLRFTSIAKKYSTGIFFTVRSEIAYRRSPRARTPAAYFKARSRPFGNPSSRSPFMTWPNKSATALRENTPQGYFLIPQGSRLCWHCAVHTYFMEQLRAEYRFSTVRALSAAVRPAFSVLICAPRRGRGESDVQFVIKAKFDYGADKRREKVQKFLKNLLTLSGGCCNLLTHL